MVPSLCRAPKPFIQAFDLTLLPSDFCILSLDKIFKLLCLGAYHPMNLLNKHRVANLGFKSDLIMSMYVFWGLINSRSLIRLFKVGSLVIRSDRRYWLLTRFQSDVLEPFFHAVHDFLSFFQSLSIILGLVHKTIQTQSLRLAHMVEVPSSSRTRTLLARV